MKRVGSQQTILSFLKRPDTKRQVYVCMTCMYVCMYICIPCVHDCMYVFMYAFCAYVRMYICMFVFTEGNFVLGRGFCPGGLCQGDLSVSPSSFHVQFVQPLASEFCIHN